MLGKLYFEIVSRGCPKKVAIRISRDCLAVAVFLSRPFIVIWHYQKHAVVGQWSNILKQLFGVPCKYWYFLFLGGKMKFRILTQSLTSSTRGVQCTLDCNLISTTQTKTVRHWAWTSDQSNLMYNRAVNMNRRRIIFEDLPYRLNSLRRASDISIRWIWKFTDLAKRLETFI